MNGFGFFCSYTLPSDKKTTAENLQPENLKPNIFSSALPNLLKFLDNFLHSIVNVRQTILKNNKKQRNHEKLTELQNIKLKIYQKKHTATDNAN